MLRAVGLSLLLAAITAALFSGVREHQLVDFDDTVVIARNPDLRPDSLADAFVRAWNANLAGNRIPATVLSLQASLALGGPEARGFLLGNVALHAAAAAVLLLALFRLTGALWASAFVAAVFALHPLHVESVAWASMRKDTLAGLAFALCLLAYAGYARRPRATGHLAVTACLALALAAKPITVTLPCVLLLLDGWPLGRLGDWPARRRAVLEKLPWFALVALASVATLDAQTASGAVVDAELLPFGERVANAADALRWYVQKSFWPTGLSVFYPHPEGGLPASRALAGAALVGALSVGALVAARRTPAVLVGWLWFVGMLVPMLGLVQVGNQARADRYTYLPQIGLALAVAFGVAAVARRVPGGRVLAAGLGLASVAALGWALPQQLVHWRDSVALHRRAVAVAPASAASQQRLGEALLREGKVADATRHIERAVALSPRRGWAYLSLGDLRSREGRLEEAIGLYRRGLQLEPDDARGHANLGLALTRLERHEEARVSLERAIALHREAPERSELHGTQLAVPLIALADERARQGALDAAIAAYEEAVALDPTRARAGGNLGLALSRAGDFERARPHLERALEVGRYNEELQAGMARTFAGLGHPRDAVRHFRNALALRPGWRHATNDLAWILATTQDEELRDPAEAVALMRGVLLEDEYQPAMLDTLGAALAADGRFDEAVAVTDEALRIARRDPELAGEIESRRELYRAGRAYVDSTPVAREPLR